MKAKKVMAFVLSIVLAAGTMMPGAEMAAYAAEEAAPADSETAEEERAFLFKIRCYLSYIRVEFKVF